jgi:NitT/TauT family transport system permease protein
MTAIPKPDVTWAHGPVEEPANRTWWAKHKTTVVVAGFRLVLLAAALAAWQLMSGPVIDPTLVSSPTAVGHQLVVWSGDGTLWRNTWITVKEVVLGYAFGAITGAAAGFLIASTRLLARVLDPFIMGLYSIPKVALAPLFIVWFGIGVQMKVVLAAATVFFLVFINTAHGVREIDPALLDSVRLMGGRRRDLLFKVMLPGSMSGLMTGLRVSVPYALIGAVIGELVASNQGLGFLINDSASQFNIAGVFAALLVLSVIAAIFNQGLTLLARPASRWKPLEDRE